ncbi:TetR/AcrR family transcriptional regulator [Burkholderia plantarii]|uniref:Transcriptional regulator, TetR family n=1 Tax=Burkholderia plantarii TaxID=41899 RepID=A0A0B6RK11_BURPL|nr:TetR/AcrR family transcriptional regulator [Burkholderia plantarii]AJK45667.1 transcriptional regulator, TetR family [Burkholderia plantarii]ALK29917.1 Transcriptional Regulator, TetR family [Burkholderia plantarii]WLE58665.1 TetR/AcrR family transcriptional regulator [Burkholderia plantarii]GLZ20843.1 TetR family transcriptional regulator [Burkholderia plantarii]
MSTRTSAPRLQPRKTPSQARAAETVAAIVEAAAQVLEMVGIEGFNTNAVAERAGVSIGSLYQYFPGKDALTVALMQREMLRFQQDLEAALDAPDGTAALERLIGAAARQQLERPMLARLLDVQEGNPALRDAVRCASMPEIVATVIRRAFPACPEPALAAADLCAMIRGLVDAAGERGERDVAHLERRVRAAVFGYLTHRSAG